MENHANVVLRQFLIKNLENIFQLYPSIPIGILLEPLIKQL